MNKFPIRAATAEDVQQISDCVQAAYQHYIERIGKPPGPMLEDYSAVVQNHHVYVAADEKGNLAGLLVLIEQENGMLLDNVAVHPNFQGRKIGRLLMQKAEHEARQMGYDSIRLYTHEMMTENRIIYQRLGYVETHRVHEKGFDRVYMQKVIN